MRSKKIPVLAILFIIFLILTFFVIFNIVFYREIIVPSLLSVAVVCDEGTEDPLNNTGFISGGLTIVQLENDTVKNITVVLFNPSDRTRKHELCHVNQALKGRLFSCDHRFLKLLTEIECYLAER